MHNTGYNNPKALDAKLQEDWTPITRIIQNMKPVGS